MAKPEAIIIFLNVLFFKLNVTFLVSKLAGTRMLFGSNLLKNWASWVIGILLTQISYLPLRVTLILCAFLLIGICLPPFSKTFEALYPGLVMSGPKVHSH